MKPPATHLALRVELERGSSSAAAEAVLEWFARSDEHYRFYWENPEAQRLVTGLGAVAVFEASGAGRFEALSESARSLFASLEIRGEAAAPAAGPQLLGGFAFADEPAPSASRGSADWEGFAPASFVLPRLLLSRDGERSWLTACASLAEHGAGEANEEDVGAGLKKLLEATLRELETCAGAWVPPPPSCAGEYCARPDRPHATYLDEVEDARRALARGALEKVVLARSLGIESDLAYQPATVLSALRAAHPACAVFAVGRGERVFLGATPERLVSLAEEHVRTSAVAGSAPRGSRPDEDEHLARTLRESKKEQEEHAIVVREIEAGLRPFCDRIERAEAPHVLGLDGIQHLETPFEARLRVPQDSNAPRANVLDLAGALHPTPAVCGTPRREAQQWIARAEGLERGWYAGALGFVDAAGGGELSVALRSGLLAGARARLYAGAGIVADSDPRAELAETRLKLRALLSQLTEI